MPWSIVVRVQSCPMSVPSPMVMPPVSWESAADVDEDVLAQGEVPAEFAVERWEDCYRLIYRLASESNQERPHFVGRAVSGVDLGDHLQRLLGGAVHKLVCFRAAFDSAAAVDVVEEAPQIHVGDPVTLWLWTSMCGRSLLPASEYRKVINFPSCLH